MGIPHLFKPINITRLASCAVCKKPFSGFLSSGVKCQGELVFRWIPWFCQYILNLQQYTQLGSHVTEAIFVFHVACDIKCHRHCAARAKPCTVTSDSSLLVKRENENVVASIDDVDKLGRFLFEKVCNFLMCLEYDHEV